GQVAQVRDPVFEPAESPGAFGEPHVQLVDGDHAPRLCGVAGRGQQGAPEVGPGRVAVHAQQGAGRFDSAFGQLRAVVQKVPGVGAAGRIHRGGGGHADAAGPGRVHSRPEGGVYHAISIMVVFRPEPTPMQSTRSPLFRVCDSCASVNGSEAGPTLPHFGKVIGTRSRTRSTALMIALVYEVETWCVTYRSIAVQFQPSRWASCQALTTSSSPLSNRPLVSVNMPAGPPTHSSWCSVPARETPPRIRCEPGWTSAGPITAAAAPEPKVSVANSRR